MRYPTEHHERPIDLSDMRALNRACRRLGRQGPRLDRPAVAPIRAARAPRLLAATFALLCSMAPAAIGHAQAQDGATDLLNALNVGNLESAGPGFGGGRRHFPYCSLAYDLPADVGPARQLAFDRLSWKSFLALNAPGVGRRVSRHGDNETQWAKWSSTDDLIQCQLHPKTCVCPNGDCSVSGSHYYPPKCREIEGYQNYRALAELSKVDDTFLQAANGSLSNDPVLDAKGKFLRFEILVSPATYDFVVENQYFDQTVLTGLQQPVNFPCGERSYTGGDPADPREGAIVLKLAWMELGSPGHPNHFRRPKGRDFHTEDVLVYTPAYRDSTGEASCKLERLALVGMHIAHKTVKQPKWIWSTFEHRRNAPDCTSLPPAGDKEGSGPSTSCPASVRRDYNFFPASCSEDGSDPQACQTCNAAPQSNALDATACTNPDVAGDTGWCLDLPPAAEAGVSKICRQIPIAANYPTAALLNGACARRLGRRSAWQNYELISTQWFDVPSDVCQTGSTATPRDSIQPQVDIAGNGQSTRPFLGNTSMESYVRSNCMGCHSNATVEENPNKVGTDLMYFLQLEVSAAAGGELGGLR